MDIAVIGAGIGGLAVAALLARDGHRITLFDQFDAPRPIGSGLVIQPVGQAVLQALDLREAAFAQGASIDAMRGHEVEHGRTVLDVSYAPRQGLAIHRASLFKLLLEAAKNAGVELVPNHKATGVTDGVVHFENAPDSSRFSLVIDASGAGSALSSLKAHALPYGAIWGTVPWPKDATLPRTELRQAYRRANRMIGVLPIGAVPGQTGDHAAVFWSMPADRLPDWPTTPLADWKAEAETLWPDVAPFLKAIKTHADMTPARYTHATLRRPYGARLAIIGDSAHRASPQLGQGANMALLDAMALRLALQDHPTDDALRAYAMARRWHVRIYQAMSWVFTPQYQSDSTFLPVLRDRVIFPMSRVPPVPRLLTRLVCGDMIPPLGSLTRG